MGVARRGGVGAGLEGRGRGGDARGGLRVAGHQLALGLGMAEREARARLLAARRLALASGLAEGALLALLEALVLLRREVAGRAGVGPVVLARHASDDGVGAARADEHDEDQQQGFAHRDRPGVDDRTPGRVPLRGTGGRSSGGSRRYAAGGGVEWPLAAIATL